MAAKATQTLHMVQTIYLFPQLFPQSDLRASCETLVIFWWPGPPGSLFRLPVPWRSPGSTWFGDVEAPLGGAPAACPLVLTLLSL